MLTSFFILCAVVGGAVFACQFVMLVVGFGGEESDFSHDIPHDLSDGVGGDIPDSADVHGHVHEGGHDSSWLFGAISLRTLVAATLFFGLAGIAAQQAEIPDGGAFLIALGGGAAALFGVAWIMKTLYKLGEDNTVRISRAVGHRGTVYIPIPPHNSGLGKIQLKLQDRIMEYAAMTNGPERLATGASIEVVSLVNPTTLEVQPLPESVSVKEI